MRGSRKGKRAPRRPVRRVRDTVSDALWTARRATADGLRTTSERGGPLASAAGRGLRGLLLVVPAAGSRIARALGRFARGVYDGVTGLLWGFVDLTGRLFGPERTVAAVAAAAAVLLGASQFANGSGVRAGAPDYSQVSAVAPAPLVSTAKVGSAHLWLLLPAAAIALGAAYLARGGRWRVARIVSLVGVAGIAVALAVDLPKGLDEGEAGVEFSGAKATMLGGFYVELAASVILVICGVLLARYLKAAAPRSRRRPRRARSTAPDSLGYAGGGT
jgi:hypothetical protein